MQCCLKKCLLSVRLLSGDAGKRRKPKRRREALVLEDDDYDLLEENQVTVPVPLAPCCEHLAGSSWTHETGVCKPTGRNAAV